MSLPCAYKDFPDAEPIALLGSIYQAAMKQPPDRENRSGYYKHGFTYEVAAIQLLNRLLGKVQVKANRRKDFGGRHSKCLHDMFYLQEEGDIKCQFTPFFTAGLNYGLDPINVVTFNEKDRINYNCEFYDNGRGHDFVIVFYVNHWFVHEANTGCERDGNLLWYWSKSAKTWVSVAPRHGFYMCRMSDIARWTDRDDPDHVPLHPYKKRQKPGEVNAQDSWLLPVDQMVELWSDQSNLFL